MVPKSAFRRALSAVGALVLALCTARCTLVHSLDYLQSAPDSSIDAKPGDDALVIEPPGCPPDRWVECGVTVLFDRGTPNGITANGLHRRVFFSDAETGTIYEVNCLNKPCTAPMEWATGEAPPRFISIEWNWLFWITNTEVRRILVGGSRDAGAQPETVSAVSEPTALSGDYPVTIWSDTSGVSGEQPSEGQVHRYSSLRATALLSLQKKMFFVSGGDLYGCTYNSTTGSSCTGEPLLVTGARGSELLAHASDFAEGDAGGLVASIRKDGGSALVLVEQLDAGGRAILTEQASEIQALAAYGKDIYFTTKSGELYWRTLDLRNVIPMLRGLGPRTSLAAAEREVFVADPDRRVVLRVANGVSSR